MNMTRECKVHKTFERAIARHSAWTQQVQILRAIGRRRSVTCFSIRIRVRLESRERNNCPSTRGSTLGYPQVGICTRSPLLLTQGKYDPLNGESAQRERKRPRRTAQCDETQKRWSKPLKKRLKALKMTTKSCKKI